MAAFPLRDHAEDQRVVRAARALEERAAALTRLPNRVPKPGEHTQGPARVFLRDHAIGEAVGLLREADALYWDRVHAHAGLIRKHAWTFCPSNVGIDEMEAYVRSGWFDALLRWDPERGIRLGSYARAYARRARTYCIRADAPTWCWTESLYTDQVGDGPEERFASEAPEAPDQLDLAKAQRALHVLPEMDRRVVQAVCDGLSFREMESLTGLSYGRNQQLYARAIQALRAALGVSV